VSSFGLRTIAAALLGFLSVEATSACSTLTPAGERKRQAERERFLANEADRTVRGTWRYVKEKTGDAEPWRGMGYVEVRRGKKVIKYHLWISDEINCGFPSYPEEGDVGLFYLKRDSDYDGMDKKNAYADDSGFVHFEETRKKAR
jgi:hypothetical protein